MSVMKGWSRLALFCDFSTVHSLTAPLYVLCSKWQCHRPSEASGTGTVRRTYGSPRSHVCYGFTYVITHIFALCHVLCHLLLQCHVACARVDHVLCHVLCHVKAKAVSRLVAPLGHGRMITRDRMFESVTSTALFAADLSRKWRRRVCTKKR